MPWDEQDVELWKRAKLVLGLSAVRAAVQHAARSAPPERSDPSLPLAENEAFRIALRAELARLLTVKGH
jgi:hypothetical protein